MINNFMNQNNGDIFIDNFSPTIYFGNTLRITDFSIDEKKSEYQFTDEDILMLETLRKETLEWFSKTTKFL